MKKIFLLVMVLALFSCKKDEVKVNEASHLIGKWDSYYTFNENVSVGYDGPAYCVLVNYEQGFEIFNNKTYLSRYTMPTNLVNTGAWRITSDSLIFNHINEDGFIEVVPFALIKLEPTELIIKRTDGLSIYLRKNL